LQHAEKEQVIFWIDPEPGARAAAPKYAALSCRRTEECRILYDAEIQAMAERRTAEGRDRPNPSRAVW